MPKQLSALHDAVTTVEEALLVKPVKPTLRHCMYLSATDMLMKFSKPSRTILFYPPSSCTEQKVANDAAEAFATLRQGLAAVLVPYYPFAGRLVLDDDSRRLVLDCNDAGVELTLARNDTVCFSELVADNYIPRTLFRELVPMDDLPRSDHTDVPVTAVQVTAFSGGGLTVGIANQHSVADGFAFWMFIKALSQACRGEPLTVQPVHWRALLRPDTVMLNCKVPPKQAAQAKQDIVPTGNNSFSYNFADSTERLMQIVVHFSKEEIDRLKQAAYSAANCAFTTYQALSAYLWKRYIMARGIDPEAPVQFLHLLDVRHRIIPPLTSGFCGNAIAGFFTVSKSEVIQEESLGATAARIRQTIQDVDDYSIKAFIMDVENPDLSNIPINLFRLRNASHFPVYEAGNFGWGEPAAVRPPISDTEGEATWYPSKKPGSIDVVFALLASTCSRFFSAHIFPNDPLDVSQLDYTTT